MANRFMGMLSRFFGSSGQPAILDPTSDIQTSSNTEIGRRSTYENYIKHLYNRFWADPDLRIAILDIRHMDRVDGRVKKIHSRTARDATKRGIMMSMTTADDRVQKAWKGYKRRVGLDNPLKLRSDARGLFMEGSLPYQWVISDDGHVAGGIRLPSETIVPIVNTSGQFEDVTKAYRQIDAYTGEYLAEFALYQLTIGRMDPDNFDDLGCMGRPYLDASRTVWKKLNMTEEDLVIRRRVRAPLRMSHVLEDANDEDMEKYRMQVENDSGAITTDYYSNKKGAVTPIQGDANLDQIADVAHLLDTFFSGAPAPKGLFGYAGGLQRDILEDLKTDYFEEVDALQESLAWVYRQGFILELLLSGINPLDFEFNIGFAARRTETASQAADLGLKWQALGMPREMIIRRIGEDPHEVREMLSAQKKENNPYPEPDNIRPQVVSPNVSITPGNAKKGESATSITTRSS